MSISPITIVPLDIAHHFADLPDPRHRAFRHHHVLGDILVIAVAAVLSGANSWDAIADFGRAKKDWLRSLGLELPNGIPSHDTFNRIFAALNPRAFQHSFTSWINAVCNTLGFCHIPIDGKAVRGAKGPDGTCLHLVSAWAAGHRLTLAQVAVADKSNEITAIPELLKLLDLHGALVSIDAIGCQKGIAQQIRDGGGDYLLAVKDNQPTLNDDIQECFVQAYDREFAGIRHTGSLEHREWAALVPGRVVRRGPVPDAAGQRGGEPGLAEEDGPVAVPARQEQGQRPHPATTGRPRRRLPHPSPQSPMLKVCVDPGNSPSIRPITGRPSLAPSSLPRCPVGLPCGSPSREGGQRGYFVHLLDRRGLGRASRPVALHPRQRSVEASVPGHIPFWFRPVSIFGLSNITAFNSTSPGLTLPPDCWPPTAL